MGVRGVGFESAVGATVRGNHGTQRSLEAKVISCSYFTIDYEPFYGLIAPNKGDLGTLSKYLSASEEAAPRSRERRRPEAPARISKCTS